MRRSPLKKSKHKSLTSKADFEKRRTCGVFSDEDRKKIPRNIYECVDNTSQFLDGQEILKGTMWKGWHAMHETLQAYNNCQIVHSANFSTCKFQAKIATLVVPDRLSMTSDESYDEFEKRILRLMEIFTSKPEAKKLQSVWPYQFQLILNPQKHARYIIEDLDKVLKKDGSVIYETYLNQNHTGFLGITMRICYNPDHIKRQFSTMPDINNYGLSECLVFVHSFTVKLKGPSRRLKRKTSPTRLGLARQQWRMDRE